MVLFVQVPGHVALRGAESLRRAQEMNRDREDQFLPRQRRDVTYISRLQSVQAAIDHQLQEMEKEYPNRRVALVTFNNEVSGFLVNEPPHGKTNNLHRRKQRRRSASR